MTAVRTGTDFIGKDGTCDKCHDSNIRIDPDVNMTEYHRLAKCQTGLRPNGLGPGTKGTGGLPMLLEGAGCAAQKAALSHRHRSTIWAYRDGRNLTTVFGLHGPVRHCAEHDQGGYQRDGDSPAASKIDELLTFGAAGAAP
jgi:hypothetical protein